MTKKLITFTIGIAAYNEADNLRRLLPTLISTKIPGHTLDQILVLSDGSSDDTNLLLTEFSDSVVRIVMGKDQRGKPARVNQIFGQVRSDILVILDADIKLNPDSLFALISVLDPLKPMVTSGIALPLAPHRLVEKIASAGVAIWTEVRRTMSKNSVYHSEGMIRAFTRPLYKELRFPPVAHMEDVYPCLYCRVHNLTFLFVPSAIVWYHLPSTFHDYRSQQRRYHTAGAESAYFSQDLIKQEFNVATIQKLIAMLRVFLRDPLYISLYLIFSLYLRVDIWLSHPTHSTTWEILTSTKKVNQ